MQGQIYVQRGPDGLPMYLDENGNRVAPPSPNAAPPQQGGGAGAAVGQLGGQVAGTATAGYLASQFAPTAATAATAPAAPAAIGGAATATMPTAGAAAAQAPAAGLFGSALPYAGPAAMIAATIPSMQAGYEAGEGRGLGSGAAAGFRGAPIWAKGAGFLGGAYGSVFGSGKGKDQRSRDQGRARLEQLGLRDAGNRGFITLPDGTQVDLSTVGADGGPSYNLDESRFNDPDFGEDVGAMNALIGTAGGGGGKRTSDLVGEQINAYNGRGGSRGAVQDTKARIEAAGGSNGSIKHGIAEAWKRGDITANERDARFAATDKLYGIKNPNDNRWENQAGLSQKEQGRNAKEQQQHRQRSTDSKRGK